jgi:ribosome maturation factor RimP
MRKRAAARFCVFKSDILRYVGKNKNHKKREVTPRDPRRKRANEQSIVRQVWSLAEPVCESEGLELIQVEYQRESAGRILRLYVDKPGGIRLDDCIGVSRQMNDILDVHLADVGPYNLEVTSPGPERPLARRQDFDKFKGARIKIKTYQPLNGRKNFKGVLLGISGDEVSLQIDEQIVTIAYADISKAHLIE